MAASEGRTGWWRRIQRVESPVKGVLIYTLAVLHTAIIGIPILVLGFVKFFVRRSAAIDSATAAVSRFWTYLNLLWFRVFTATEFEVDDPPGLSHDGSYLIVANHVSTADIVILSSFLSQRIPLTRFFLKREVFYVPVIGMACWALDMPFMYRYSRRQLAAQPHLKGRDMEATRKSCERYRGRPTTLVNYAEGTRFRPEKHARQQSPYRYLLRPKAGGIALTLAILGEQIDAILDCTFVFPEGGEGIWEMACGRTPRAVLKIEPRPVPVHLLGRDYANSEADRAAFQTWLGDVWAEKDRLIGTIRGDIPSDAAAEVEMADAPQAPVG